ncbi:alkanesulfonate monooxygenase SsuD/methylene tetrahydromethanopterin reductase-like flavin-dependent oxidoreductase (luciferase family) [Crossiella cryophila]|uniref:Alkanesulfonate monooxygenase SsuD/methylene tetrahydromethanopterin reductase-like flavin-dependent oxidoreductase (Luciferase family) n=1 Tax=Crossiella cryophila TaxID=43355 RepID=A0A7W7CFU5_9PSEU|nr:alkanesulfonate monooxygenase SsuD/methylene tetrahydromethanopterin reductase-like flavin-dependent oxidoreductase (luciferase family) [Crossiella cryophila]
MLTLSSLADQAGLSHVKMTEHYLHPYGGYCPNPLTFLAAVAARTRRIRLMTGCLLPAFHHPVQLAAETAMVDALSGGRLDVGFARAYLPYEFETFGVRMDESRARYEATIKAVLRLWTEQGVSERTPFFSYQDATSLPRPVQPPHPPVWGAAVRSRQSFAWLGEQGFGLLVTPTLSSLAEMRDHIEVYREAFEDNHGSTGRSPRVAASLPLYVGATEVEAARTGDALLGEYLEVWAEATDSWRSTRSADYQGYTGMATAIRGLDVRALRESGGAVVGSVERVVDRVSEVRAELTADCFLWQVDFGGVTGQVAETSLRRFIDEVLPALAG